MKYNRIKASNLLPQKKEGIFAGMKEWTQKDGTQGRSSTICGHWGKSIDKEYFYNIKNIINHS